MEQIFSKVNVIYWGLICIIVWLETKLLTNNHAPYAKKWPGPNRWWLGWATLFSSSLVMVILEGWDFWTWAGLALATAMFRRIKPHALMVGWQRSCREYHRWTLGYFLAFVLCIPGVAFGPWDASTWVKMFFSLGLCGASKVGWEAYFHSLKADELRQKPRREEVEHGPAT